MVGKDRESQRQNEKKITKTVTVLTILIRTLSGIVFGTGSWT